MSRPIASVSLDLDNLWSYMKTHGDAGWEEYPSYLPIVVPRVLDLCDRRGWKMTWFIVGKDADDPSHHPILRQITERGHEVGNHSFKHEPWLHLYTPEEIDAELARAEQAIMLATGQRPTGFRGPGFSVSIDVLRTLKRRGYRFDASTFPTYLGPLARLYYFAKSRNFSAGEKSQRKQLFGKLSEGLRPLKPYNWNLPEGTLAEIPVTTMPLFKVPIHLSYLLYLGCYSKWLAKFYFGWALRLCRWTHTSPSLLLHPLDFMGRDDTEKLAFFPAMNQTAAWKVGLAEELLGMLEASFDPVPMGVHAERIAQARAVPRRVPAF